MLKKNGHKKQYPIKRSAYSGKIVNGHEVVMVNEVLDYVKKLGYEIYNTKLVFDD